MPDEEQHQHYSGGSYTETVSDRLDPSLAKLLLDMNESIQQLAQDLRGYYPKVVELEPGKWGEVWEKSDFQMMNEEGVRFVVSVLHSYLSPMTPMTALSDKQIQIIMEGFHKHLAGAIMDKQDEWGIDNSYMYVITDKITNLVWMCLLRAKEGKTLYALMKSHKSVETREIAPKKKKWLLF